jgi:hypothetical protein
MPVSPVEFQSNPPQQYIASSGRGDDRGVHHRLPDGTAVTYADIRRAVEEGRGEEDVSAYFNGQTNAQALGAHRLVSFVEDPPPVLGAVFALASRSWLSFATTLTTTLARALTDKDPEPAPTAIATLPRASADEEGSAQLPPPVAAAAEALRFRQASEQ